MVGKGFGALHRLLRIVKARLLSLTQIRDTTLGLVLIGLHQDAITAQDFILVNLDWELLYPVFWSEFKGEGDYHDGCGPKHSLEELFISNFVGLEDKLDPVCRGPLHGKDNGKNDNESQVVEELLEDVVLGSSNDTTVDHIEKLKEHESVEDNRIVGLLVLSHC